MASSGETLENLKITREEFDRITDAMKQEEFRKLFVEYCEEISDPENRKKYEDEIKELESQRGVDCKFVHPNPGFVVKTTDGKEKVFINIAKNDLVDRPSYESASSPDGKIGMNWSIPLIQAPVRKDMDKKNQWCSVYDVIFHPETLAISERDSRFRQMVVQTAIDAVINAYKVDLDKANLRFPKMEYKGMAKPTVIRKTCEEKQQTNVDMGLLTDIMPPMPMQKEKIVQKVTEETKPPEFTVPKYAIKYRKKMEMHEFTGQIDAKINSSVPSEMSIEIHLPLLRSASETVLDVSRNRLSLFSYSPAKYQLELNLSYDVNDKDGNAYFDKEKRTLTVTIPIIPKHIGVLDIEKDKKPPIEILSESFQEDEIKNYELTKANFENDISFFDPNLIYESPNFHIVSFDGQNVTFFIEISNVTPDSVVDTIIDGQYHLKFTSLGDGYFPVVYGTIISFNDLQVVATNVTNIECQLLLELKMNKNISEDHIFYVGPPGIERGCYRVISMYNANKSEYVKTRSRDLLVPTPKTIELECLKTMDLQK